MSEHNFIDVIFECYTIFWSPCLYQIFGFPRRKPWSPSKFWIPKTKALFSIKILGPQDKSLAHLCLGSVLLFIIIILQVAMETIAFTLASRIEDFAETATFFNFYFEGKRSSFLLNKEKLDLLHCSLKI